MHLLVSELRRFQNVRCNDKNSLDLATDLSFENRVMRKVFGSKRDEVTGIWVKLRNDMLCGGHC